MSKSRTFPSILRQFFSILLLVLIGLISKNQIQAQTPTPIPNPLVDITEYGAIPNDSQDDTLAINNAAAATQPNDTLFFPEGTYLISNSILPKSETKILGEEQAQSILKFTGNTQTIGMIKIEQKNNIEIANLVIDADNNKKAVNGIYTLQSNNLNLHDLTIKNFDFEEGVFGPHGIHFNQEVTASIISKNSIMNIAPNGEWGGGIRLSHSSNNKVLNNTISNTGRGGILTDESANLIIQKNNVSGSHGLGLGIELWGNSNNSLVEDNIIDHWLSVGGDNLAIRRNTISDKSGVYKFTGIEFSGKDSIFTDNIVDDGAQLGISESGPTPKEYIFWGYNTISSANTWGVQIQGETGGARYHYFYKDKFLNTYKDHPQAWYPNQGHGFRFNSDSYYFTLDSVEINNNGGVGLQFTPGVDQISIINSTISDNKNIAVTAYEGNDLEWENNIVTGNTDNTQPSSIGFNNQKPTALIIASSQANTNEPTNFISNSTDPDGTIKHVLWDFNDGLPSTSPSARHIYKDPGKYRISLIVWDNLGRADHAEKSIEIIKPSPSPTPTSTPKPNCGSDINCDGKVDYNDLISWRNLFNQKNQNSDINNDNTRNIADYIKLFIDWLAI